jgi:magnesium transporter
VDDSGGALEELRKHMEAAQEIWELGLDTTRNRIIQANLMMSMATLSMSL